MDNSTSMLLDNYSPTAFEKLINYSTKRLTEPSEALTFNKADNVALSFPHWRDIARPEQLAPAGNWRFWVILAGRGFGKTRSIGEWGIEQAKTMPGSRGAVVGATAADVRDVLIEGESGIMSISRDDFRPIYEPSKRRLTWPNGSIATTYSADEPERLRGPQHHWSIGDELAAWRYPLALDMLMMGLRLGDDPRAAFATTPKPVKFLKEFLKDISTVVTRGSTYDNRANLATAFFSQIIRKYEGTRLGRQELNAEILDDAPGALWKRDWLDDPYRVTKYPDLVRIVVSIDPAPTSGEDSNQTGLTVEGRGVDDHGYLLHSEAMRDLPTAWAKQAVALYHLFRADCIIGEANNGGDMIESLIRAVDANVKYKKVHASRGKVTRAEPVAALYEQHRVHHVGNHAELEDQYCQWEQGMESPDLLDSAVWGLTELMLGGEEAVEFADAPDWYRDYRGL